MNKSELAERLAGRTGMSKAAAKDAVEGVFEVIGEALANGEDARFLGPELSAPGTVRPVQRVTRGWAKTCRSPRRPFRCSGLERRSRTSWPAKRHETEPVQVSGTSDAGGGLDIESTRLRHDDGRPRSYLQLTQRITGRQWVAPAALGSLQAQGQNRQKHVWSFVSSTGHPIEGQTYQPRQLQSCQVKGFKGTHIIKAAMNSITNRPTDFPSTAPGGQT